MSNDCDKAKLAELNAKGSIAARLALDLQAENAALKAEVERLKVAFAETAILGLRNDREGTLSGLKIHGYTVFIDRQGRPMVTEKGVSE